MEKVLVNADEPATFPASKEALPLWRLAFLGGGVEEVLPASLPSIFLDGS